MSCQSHIQPIVSKIVHITDTKSIPVFCVGAYEEPLKTLILAKSWSMRITAFFLAELIWKRTPISTIHFDCIVPVPLHWQRYAYRGYNQAEVMARELARYSKRPVKNCIKRIKHTSFQSSLAVKDRPSNVQNAFAFVGDPSSYYGKTFLIVDDLMTTGSTLKAVAQEINKKCKPLAIYAVVAARVV